MSSTKTSYYTFIYTVLNNYIVLEFGIYIKVRH